MIAAVHDSSLLQLLVPPARQVLLSSSYSLRALLFA
jgi:hypothetical protein